MPRQKRLPSLTLETIFDSKTYEERWPKRVHWMRDGRRLSFIDQAPASELNTVWILDSETGERNPVFAPEELRIRGDDKSHPVHSFTWSPKETSLLLPQIAPARFSSTGNLFLFDIQARTFRPLTNTDQPQRHPAFSPDGRYLGLVRADDLWVIDVATGAERRLTFDASATVYNGRYGWVYEEELHLESGWAWSPDSSRIAFAQQDESAVPEVLLPQYDDLHQTPILTRYPKPGDVNPTTRVGVLNVASGDIQWLTLGVETGDHYLARLQWTPDGKALLIQRIPRLQNRLDLLLADVGSGDVRTVLTETDPAWVELPGEVQFAGKSDRFIWPSDRDGCRHLYLYNLKGRCIRKLTEGKWDVDTVFSATEQAAHFAAIQPDPWERRIFRVVLKRDEPEMLSANRPGWNWAWFSEDGTRYLHRWCRANRPSVYTVRSLEHDRSALVMDVADGPLADLTLLPWEFMEVENRQGDRLSARMMKPPAFDPTRRYPALMSVYGGPGPHQMVVDGWIGSRSLWSQVYAEQGYVVFVVDNRGTGGRGREFKKQVYLRLGEREAEDQIDAGRYLASQPYIDERRIGIWGWSFGGYLATLCMLRGEGLFRAGVAVAPVTDWTLYDSIYTERYMRTPALNAEGYAATSALADAARLQGDFLLMHGLMDDNVHFQNSARLAEALQEAKRPFEMMVYPGRKHALEDRHYHVHSAMRRFFRRHLGR